MRATLIGTALRRTGRLLAFVGIQVVLILALLEVAGRVFDPLGVSYFPETSRYLDTLVLEEPIGYRNRPGLEGRFYGAPVKINSLGMRDREAGPKQDGEFRVLVQGDSIPFGIGVPVEDALPMQLERKLQAREPARKVRTLNLGVPSYNTEQELIQLRTLGLKLEPDVVILYFTSNDIEPKRWVLDKRARWYVDLAQRSYAISLAYVLYREAGRRLSSGQTKGPATGAVAGLDGSGVRFNEYRLDSPRWLAIDRSLTEMHRLLKQRGVRFVLFSPGEVQAALDLLEGVAKREGFEFYVLRRYADPRWRGMDENLFRNSVIDGHPSARGNEALATMIAERLAHGGGLGDAPK